jgi:hypothetical protein|tara:strand:- start:567 stop:749 length:183 start_codon:yes stop_codon:yes gene_type:complete
MVVLNKRCVFCKIGIPPEFSHNPAPIYEYPAVCCETCNYTIVIPKRLAMMFRGEQNERND